MASGTPPFGLFESQECDRRPAELRSAWTGEGARPHTGTAHTKAKAPLESRALLRSEVRRQTPTQADD
jgi:hypothetical protein